MTVLFQRQSFFDAVRTHPFPGRLTTRQVRGMEAILNRWEAEHPGGDLRWLAYMLATAYHETGARMQPVREGFAATDARARKIIAKRDYGLPDPATGHVYYGRGLVQITWKENYDRMGRLIGLDLVNEPDRTLDPAVSITIMFEGMTRGLSKRGDFTGRSLEHYFNASTDDPVGARAIINGSDKADKIAGHHADFLKALTLALIPAARPKPPALRRALPRLVA